MGRASTQKKKLKRKQRHITFSVKQPQQNRMRKRVLSAQKQSVCVKQRVKKPQIKKLKRKQRVKKTKKMHVQREKQRVKRLQK
jgi:hypothetical protein